MSVPLDGLGREAAWATLAAQLAGLPARGFAEVWVDHDSFPALWALVNGDHGWLMFIRHEGDPGFSSRNPGYSGPTDTEIEYILGNGQLDRYPAAWAYPRAQVFEALQSFARTRRVNGLSWFNDSGDGATSPSEPGWHEE